MAIGKADNALEMPKILERDFLDIQTCRFTHYGFGNEGVMARSECNEIRQKVHGY